MVLEITMKYEIALATNKILRLELKETRDVLAARKERQKGKRMVIKGQHHITTKPILKKIRNTETETEKRRSSIPYIQQPGTLKFLMLFLVNINIAKRDPILIISI